MFSFDALDSPLAGITLWGTLTKWFEMAGYELVFSNVGITQAGIKGINELNSFVTKGYKVVTLISDGLLKGQTSSLTLPNHWIVWESPLVEDAAGHVQMKLFSWGKVSDWIEIDSDVLFFTKRFFGGMVFKPLA